MKIFNTSEHTQPNTHRISPCFVSRIFTTFRFSWEANGSTEGEGEGEGEIEGEGDGAERPAALDVIISISAETFKEFTPSFWLEEDEEEEEEEEDEEEEGAASGVSNEEQRRLVSWER